MASEGKLRAFLDTNVLFSGLYSEAGAPRRLLDAAVSGRFQAVISRIVIDELVRNLRGKAPSALSSLERLFSETAFEVAPDPAHEEVEVWSRAGLGSDAPIVAAALLAGVDCFCTGDRNLLGKLSLLQRSGLRAVTPGEFVELLDSGAAR